MQHTYRARLLGWRLGRAQRAEHDGATGGATMAEAAVRAVAQLAWRFERHGLPDAPYLRSCFVAGYEQGYRLAERPASLVTRA